MPYGISDHKHRYAAWAAGRASATSSLCRFEVNQAKEILEDIGLDELLSNPDRLPPVAEIDVTHRAWRTAALASAARLRIGGFTHGVAAKLINVYAKGVLVCAGHHDHPKVVALHPPIDSVLLDALYANSQGDLKAAWGRARRARWSKFTSEQYEDVIAAVRQKMGNRPLWEIEEHWQGFQ